MSGLIFPDGGKIKMSQSSSRWLFVTAGLGTNEFEDAAVRIAHQVEKFPQIDAIRIITVSDLKMMHFSALTPFTLEEASNLPGFGFYAWKPLIALSFFNGIFGEYEGIFFLDAGCEATSNFLTRIQMRSFLSEAEQLGAVVFSSAVREDRVSKSILRNDYDSNFSNTEQIASGSWFLHGKVGQNVAEAWAQRSFLSRETLDNSTSKEVADFIAHRHEQSTFSLVCKEIGINPTHKWRRYPPGEGGRYFTTTRSLIFPFVWSRNRSGKSRIFPYKDFTRRFK
jgi:hypothetical protein